MQSPNVETRGTLPPQYWDSEEPCPWYETSGGTSGISLRELISWSRVWRFHYSVDLEYHGGILNNPVKHGRCIAIQLYSFVTGHGNVRHIN